MWVPFLSPIDHPDWWKPPRSQSLPAVQVQQKKNSKPFKFTAGCVGGHAHPEHHQVWTKPMSPQTKTLKMGVNLVETDFCSPSEVHGVNICRHPKP